MTRVVLGLGSNRKNQDIECVDLLRLAVSSLRILMNDIACSSVYKTKAMYVENQDDFYNMAIVGTVEDSITPKMLLEKIHEIEASLGRNRLNEIRFGPRTIDIDIELFGKERINEVDLIIPHERLMERAFVLIPLLEILPNCADLLDKRNVEDSLKGLKSEDIELFMSKTDFLKD